MIKYASPHVTEADIRAVDEVLRSGFLTQGKVVPRFEKEVARYVNARYAVAFNSATTALYSAYKAVGIVGDTSVATTPISFVATANMLKVLGAKVWFQDRQVITGDFVVPVHYAGRPFRFYGKTVVEDGSHALGSVVEGKKVGCCLRSSITVFSTHAIKNITTGEGGIATTNQKDLAELLRATRDHGRVNRECTSFGWNFRMTEIQGALGRSQLSRINTMRDMRQDIFDFYNKNLAGYVVTPEERSEPTFWHLYPIHAKNQTARDKLRAYLRRRGIETQIHYKPIYLEPAYQADGYEEGLCPQAERFWQTELSLPMHCGLSDKELRHIVDCVRRGVK